MTHGDDDGLVIPPKLAPTQVVIIPIYKSEEELSKVSEKAELIKKELEELNIRVKHDDRDTHKPGWKFAEYELQGVPIRIAIGPRDLENDTVEIARRDTKEKSTIDFNKVSQTCEKLLQEIQLNIYKKALSYREEHTSEVNTYDEFKTVLEEKTGFIYAHWDGTPETEAKIKEETKATIRCIPLNNKKEKGKCIYSGKPSEQRVLFARSY